MIVHGAERRRCVVLLGMVVALVLGLAAPHSAGAQQAADYAALETVRVRLDRDLSVLQRAVWIHSGSLVVLIPAPILTLPVGTLIGADMAINAAESYRSNVAGVLGESPLPPLAGARAWYTAGAVGYATGGVAFAALATMAFSQAGGGPDLDLPIAISAVLTGSGFLLGITGTTVATWRSRNTTRRFDRALDRTTAVRD